MNPDTRVTNRIRDKDNDHMKQHSSCSMLDYINDTINRFDMDWPTLSLGTDESHLPKIQLNRRSCSFRLAKEDKPTNKEEKLGSLSCSLHSLDASSSSSSLLVDYSRHKASVSNGSVNTSLHKSSQSEEQEEDEEESLLDNSFHWETLLEEEDVPVSNPSSSSCCALPTTGQALRERPSLRKNNRRHSFRLATKKPVIPLQDKLGCSLNDLDYFEEEEKTTRAVQFQVRRQSWNKRLEESSSSCSSISTPTRSLARSSSYHQLQQALQQVQLEEQEQPTNLSQKRRRRGGSDRRRSLSPLANNKDPPLRRSQTVGTTPPRTTTRNISPKRIPRSLRKGKISNNNHGPPLQRSRTVGTTIPTPTRTRPNRSLRKVGSCSLLREELEPTIASSATTPKTTNTRRIRRTNRRNQNKNSSNQNWSSNNNKGLTFHNNASNCSSFGNNSNHSWHNLVSLELAEQQPPPSSSFCTPFITKSRIRRHVDRTNSSNNPKVHLNLLLRNGTL